MKKTWERRDVLLKLDIRSAKFIDDKVILQKPEDTKYACWRKEILKIFKIGTY